MLRCTGLKWRFFVAFLVVVVLLFCLIKIVSYTPEKAFDRFLSDHGMAEDALMDPLILAGDGVVPLVIDAVRNKDLERRRYAITFLGNGGYREALPVLEEIAGDKTEEIWIREDALVSACIIDKKVGLRLIQQYGQGPSLEACLYYDKRSYLEALLSWHD